MNKTLVLAKGEDKKAFMQEHGINRMVLNMSEPDENGVLDIWIDETIGMWETDKAIFRMELNTRDAKVINLRISSGGGFLDDAIAIYHLLKDYPAEINAYIEGTVASAATVIAMAADTIYASNYSNWLVHNPYMLGMGDYRDMQRATDMLRQFRDTIAKMYKTKTGKPLEELYTLMDEDRLMSASEAKQMGFFDSLFEPATDKTKKKRMKNVLSGEDVNPEPHKHTAEVEMQMLELQLALQNAKLNIQL